VAKYCFLAPLPKAKFCGVSSRAIVKIESAVRSKRLRNTVLVVIVLAMGPKVCEFKPSRGRWMFNADKNPLHDFLRRGSKDVGPMS
jgi:hypothetical protein